MDLSGNGAKKRAYEAPRLTTYGNLRELTENLTNTGIKNDSGGGGKTKT